MCAGGGKDDAEVCGGEMEKVQQLLSFGRMEGGGEWRRLVGAAAAVAGIVSAHHQSS